MTAKIPPGLVDCYLAAIEVLYPDRPPDTPFTAIGRQTRGVGQPPSSPVACPTARLA